MKIARLFLLATIAFTTISCAPAIKLDDTNSHYVDMNIKANTTGLKLSFLNDRNRLVEITDIPANGSYRVPNYQQIELRVSGYDSSKSFIEPSNKILLYGSEHTLKADLTLKFYKDELIEEYNTFSSDEKRKIHKVYTMFVVARETPRFMFAAKTAEAQGELSIVRSEIAGFNATKLYQKMSDLGKYMMISSERTYLHESVTPLFELIGSVFND